MKTRSSKPTDKRKLTSKEKEPEYQTQIFVSKMMNVKKLIRYYDLESKDSDDDIEESIEEFENRVQAEKKEERKKGLIKRKMLKSFEISAGSNLKKKTYLNKFLNKLALRIDSRTQYNIKDFKTLKCLRRIEFLVYAINEKIFLHLNQNWKALKNLQSFLCHFSMFNGITPEGISYLGKGLRLFTFLKDLNLNFAHCSKMNDENLLSLSNYIGVLSNKICLQNLTLDFQGWRITKEGVLHLSRMLGSFECLQSLSLNLSYCKLIQSKEISELSNNFQLLRSLKRISLTFSGCNLSDEDLSNLSQNLLKLTNLTNVTLNLKNQKTTGSSLLSLGQNLGKLKSLQSIHLDLDNWKSIHDEGLLNLTSNFQYLEFLIDISLSFVNWTEITDKGLSSLSNHLRSKNLKNLSLAFHGCKKITDKGLKDLTKNIICCESLESIVLDLSLLEITDNGVSNLCKDWKGLTNLQKINFNFTECKKIKNKGLSTLSQELGAVTSLKSLSLLFDGCEDLSDKGLGDLGKNIKKLQFLKNILLQINQCVKITDQGINNLCQSLRGLNSLERVSLDFASCKITSEGLSSIINNLRLLHLRSVALDFACCNKLGLWCSDEWNRNLWNWVNTLESFIIVSPLGYRISKHEVFEFTSTKT